METNTLEKTEHQKVLAFNHIKDLTHQALKNPAQFIKNDKNIEGISSGFSQIDKITNGFQKGELTIISVKKGMGKTSFALSLINNIGIKNKISTAVFSLERPAEKIIQRMIVSETGISLNKINQADFTIAEKFRLQSAISTIANSNIYINDALRMDYKELEIQAKALISKSKIELLLIDYLELFIPLQNTTAEEKTLEDFLQIVSNIKKLAKDLDIPIILFSQLPGMVEIEAKNDISISLPDYVKEADALFYLNRSKYYKINGQPDCQKPVNNNCAELLILKHPSIKEPEKTKLTFVDSISKFVDFES